jgi:K+-sensing histidine kinase KdpD
LLIDKHRVKQILIILISNSVKYTIKGNIKVLINYEHGIVKIEIKDTGVGIKKDMLSSIFEPFSYMSAQFQHNETRVGIHMFLCNEIIKLLNGKIELQSEEQKGTEILLQIPTLDPETDTLACKFQQTEVRIFNRMQI